MSGKDQVVVVIGASGVVGSGVVRAWLDDGATVVAVSRRAENLARLRDALQITDEPLLDVVGDFADEGSAAAARQAVASVLDGRAVDHVVSVQGFVAQAVAPTETPLDDVRAALDSGLYTNLLAARVFLPDLADREGSSFTLVSGGFAHFPPPDVRIWLGTLKNAALNGLGHALAAETRDQAVRVNTVCIHVSVASIGGSANQLGMPSSHDTRRLGPAFVGLTRSEHEGEIVCIHDWEVADRLAAAR